MAKIIPPGRNDALIDRFMKAAQRMNIWMQSVSDLSTLEGTGTPEGAVDGAITRQYLDTAAGKLYVKTTDGGDTGWSILN